MWRPPPNTLKFNVDGSARGSPSVSGVGGVLRNSVGDSLGVFSLATGILWAYQSEVKAIHRALSFCKEFSFSHVYIESDSTPAVGWVNRKENRPWALLNDLNSIDRLIREVDCLGVAHVYTEANSEADELAKLGCREDPLWEILV